MAETATYTIRFEVKGREEVRDSETAVGKLDRSLSGAGGKMKALGIATAAAVAGLAVMKRAVDALVNVLDQAADKAIVQAQAVAQMEAVIKSTGGSAQRSVEQIEALAGSIQSFTTVGDEATIQMASLLATFKSIAGPEFDRTVQAVVDLSTRMGSLESAAILLGKALDDPARRASELSRSGIVLTESQKELIKSFEEVGNRAAAQNVILSEVESQFGGAAAAAAQAAGGGILQLQNAVGDLEEALGIGLVEAVDDAARSLTAFAQQDDTIAAVEALGDAVGATAAVFIDYGETLLSLVPLLALFGGGVEAVADQIPPLQFALAALGEVAEDVLRKMREVEVERTEPFGGFRQGLIDLQSEFDGVVRISDAAFERMAMGSLGVTMTVEEATEALKDVNAELEKARQRLDRLQSSRVGALVGAGFSVEQQLGFLAGETQEALETGVDEGLDHLIEQWGPGIEETATAALEAGAAKASEAVQPMVAELESPFDELWDRAGAQLGQATANALLSGDVVSAVNSLAAAFSSSLQAAVTGALEAAGKSSALSNIGGGLAGAGVGVVVGLYQSFQAAADRRRAEAERQQAEAARKLKEAFEDLTDFLESTTGPVLLRTRERFDEIIEAMSTALEINSRYAETLEAVGIATRDLRNELLGISDEGFGDVLLAAIEFNQRLPELAEGLEFLARAALGRPGGGPLDETPVGGIAREDFERIMGDLGADVDYEEFQNALKEGIENALALIPAEIDLTGLLDQMIEEFQGFGGRAEAGSIRETADSLRDAARAITDLSDADLAARIDEITEAEERRLDLLAAGPMQDLLDIWERAGGDQNEIARKRAEIEQLILTTKILEARVTLEAAGRLTEAWENIINATLEWVGDLNNLLEGVSIPSVGRINVGGGGRRGRGRGRRRDRQRAIEDFERALQAWQDLDLSPFVRQARDLREERDRLLAEARRLGRSSSEVIAAFNVAMRNLIETANESLIDLIEELRGGALSGLGAGAQFATAQAEYQRLLTAARFDPALRDDLAQVAREMINLRQQAFGPVGYRDFVNQTLGQLERVVGRDALQPKTQLSELETQTGWLERIYGALSGEEVTATDRSTWQRQDETNRHLSDVARGVAALNEQWANDRVRGLVTEDFKSPERSAA